MLGAPTPRVHHERMLVDGRAWSGRAFSVRVRNGLRLVGVEPVAEPRLEWTDDDGHTHHDHVHVWRGDSWAGFGWSFHLGRISYL